MYEGDEANYIKGVVFPVGVDGDAAILTAMLHCGWFLA